ncbi:MAG: hypothetical protein ACTSXU_16125 [Promethearchaeota archaeon]
MKRTFFKKATMFPVASIILMLLAMTPLFEGNYSSSNITKQFSINHSGDTSIENDYFQLKMENDMINSLKIDANGTSSYSSNILKDSLGAYLMIDDKFIAATTYKIINKTATQLILDVKFKFLNDKNIDYTSNLTVSLVNDDLMINGYISPISGELDEALFGVYLSVPFIKEGYDTSINSTIFSRFYTSSFDYVPIEQFKRRDTIPVLKGYYSWIVASGVDGLGYDLNFSNFNLRTDYLVKDDRLIIGFPSPSGLSSTQEKATRKVTISVIDNTPPIPEQYPYFYTSNSTFDGLLNHLFLERAFSFPPNGGQSDWLEWENTIIDWMSSPYLEKMKIQLLNINLEDDGYVYTWGDKIGWPFPDNDVYNTRHYTSNPNYILGSWRYFTWTKDDDFLNESYEHLHDATMYMVKNISKNDFIFTITAENHEGFGLIVDPETKEKTFQSVGSNYWDILPFGYKSAYCNAYMYGALKAMSDIELYKGNVSGFNFLMKVADKLKQSYNDLFWDNLAGRYIGCIDADGNIHDHGFVFLNLEAVYYGLANISQVFRINDWLFNEPTATGKKDVYSAFKFAPRATTDFNEDWWFAKVNPDFGGQVQDGGAILYTSGYDIRARRMFLGVDDAFTRMQEMLARYKLPDKLCGGSPRYTGEIAQQENPGGVGTDIPFPESGLAPVSFIEGILGIKVNSTHLILHPILPSALSFMGVNGLQVSGVKMDVNITRNNITIKHLSGSPLNNFSIVTYNNSLSVQDLILNNTFVLDNDAMMDEAGSLLNETGNVINASIKSGQVLDLTGKNQSAFLDERFLNATRMFNESNYQASIKECRSIINYTSYLVSNGTLVNINNHLNSLDNLERSIQGKLFLSPEARELKEKALLEIKHARKSYARGSGTWFLVHYTRSNQHLEAANLKEAENLSLSINLYFIMPIFYSIGLISVIWLRTKKKPSI